MAISIILRRHTPGIAGYNRVLAYAKAFAESGQHVNMIYLITRKDNSKLDIDNPNIRCFYLWENQFSKFLHPLLMYIINVLRLPKYINHDDVIYMYSPMDSLLLYFAFYKLFHSNRIFLEYTEYPFIKKLNSFKKMIVRLRTFYMKKTNGIFVISKALKNYYKEEGIYEEKLHVINMFVDISRFAGIQKIEADPYICYCGSNAITKDGVDDLIKSFALFRKKHMEYKLIICHKNVPDFEIDYLNNLAKELNVENAVLFKKDVAPEIIPIILTNSKMLVLERPNTQQAQFGFPTKLGEYLATGNPTIVTRVGEIPNYLKHKKNAFLVDAGNVEAFANEMCYVADHYEEAIAVGKEGQRMTFAEFSSEKQSLKALSYMI